MENTMIVTQLPRLRGADGFGVPSRVFGDAKLATTPTPLEDVTSVRTG